MNFIQAKHNRNINIANAFSLFRIILIPIIVCLLIFNQSYTSYLFYDHLLYLKQNNVYHSEINSTTYYVISLQRIIAFVLFVIAVATDFIDGYLARKYDLITNFGKFFDAIADKLLTNVVLIVFATLNPAIVWIVCLLIMRDFIMDGWRQILAKKQVVLAANKWGKYRAALEMFAIMILFLFSYKMVGQQHYQSGGLLWKGESAYNWEYQVALIPLYVATLLSWVSLGKYFMQTKQYWGQKSNE